MSKDASQKVIDAPDEVGRLLAAGKCKQAVELAKEEHKRQKSPESESLLVGAYLSRIEQFQARGAMEDAGTLLKLVAERFPAQRARLLALEVKAAAAAGKVDEVVAPLGRGDVSEELRLATETAIRQQLVDLPKLAAAPTLPEGHALKVAAGAIWRAFEAVTSGPVNDDQIALPEVSRRSPLAGWKLLVRAIAAFYRSDYDDSRRALDGIPADAAAARATPVLKAMMEETPAGPGAAGALAGADRREQQDIARGAGPHGADHEGDQLREGSQKCPGSTARLFRIQPRACAAPWPGHRPALRAGRRRSGRGACRRRILSFGCIFLAAVCAGDGVFRLPGACGGGMGAVCTARSPREAL